MTAFTVLREPSGRSTGPSVLKLIGMRTTDGTGRPLDRDGFIRNWGVSARAASPKSLPGGVSWMTTQSNSAPWVLTMHSMTAEPLTPALRAWAGQTDRRLSRVGRFSHSPGVSNRNQCSLMRIVEATGAPSCRAGDARRPGTASSSAAPKP